MSCDNEVKQSSMYDGWYDTDYTEVLCVNHVMETKCINKKEKPLFLQNQYHFIFQHKEGQEDQL